MAEIQQSDQSGEEARTFLEFVMMHAQQAALFLGQFPHPETGERVVNLNAARLFIDQLVMIRSKTRGNLSNSEESVLKEAISSLQMAFIEASQAAGQDSQSPGSPAAPAQGEEPSASSSNVEFTSPEDRPPGPDDGDSSKKRFTKSYG